MTNSVVVFAVREGNPKKLRTWDDLTKPGVSVITPNPFTSGGARWNVMAAYGAWLEQGLKPKRARAKLLALFKNVSVQDKSARDALNTFLSGKGDVLLDVRERGDRRTAREAACPVRDPERNDPHREPDRGARGQREQGRREQLPPLPERHRTHSRSSPTMAIARSSRTCSRRTGRSSRSAPTSSPSTTSASAAGTRCRRLLRSQHGRDGGHRAPGRGRHWLR